MCSSDLPSGCSDTVYNTVHVFEDFAIFIPNAFTPNSDGVNEGFKPLGYGWKTYNMYIYDRWGLQLFHTDKPEETWNGKVGNDGLPCQNDVYEYVIVCSDLQGGNHRYIGHVTLTR